MNGVPTPGRRFMLTLGLIFVAALAATLLCKQASAGVIIDDGICFPCPPQTSYLNVSLTPESATKNIGEEHTFNLRVTYPSGTPYEGQIYMERTGVDPGWYCYCTTDANGEDTFTFTNNGQPGTDTLLARAQTYTGGTTYSGSDTATVEFVDPNAPPPPPPPMEPDNRGPYVNILTPESGLVIDDVRQQPAIQYEAYDQEVAGHETSGLAWTKVEYSVLPYESPSWSFDDPTEPVLINPKQIGNRDVLVKVTARDNAGYWGSDTATISIRDYTPMHVTGFGPSGTGVSRSAKPFIQYDDTVARCDYKLYRRLSDGTWSRLATTRSYAEGVSRVSIVASSYPLRANTVYKVSTRAVESGTGNVTSKVWQFRTRA